MTRTDFFSTHFSTLSKCLVLALIGLSYIFPASATIKSTSGNIDFDPNSNGNVDMTLNASGLGIGTTSPSSNLHILGNAILENGNVGIGTTATTNSTLEVHGSFGFGIETLSDNTTLSGNSAILVDTQGTGNVIVDLPSAQASVGREYLIKKIHSGNTVTVISPYDLGIDDGYGYDLSSSTVGYPFVKLVSGGNRWHITSRSPDGISAASSSTNLVGWWKFDEASGAATAIDSSNNGKNGTITGVAAGNIGVDGQIEKAIDLDGSNDHIVIPASFGDFGRFDDFTIAFWFKSAGNGNHNSVISKYTDASNWYYLGLNDSNKLRYFNDDPTNGDTDLITAASYNDSAWHHAVLVRKDSGTDVIFYVDGSNVVENLSANASTTSRNTGTNIGRYPGNAHYFFGLLDDLRVYNKALSASEVQNLYQAAQ